MNERITGFEEAIAGKGFEIVARYDTKGDLEQSRQAMEEILAQYSSTLTQSCAGMISPRWGHWFPLGLLKETIS